MRIDKLLAHSGFGSRKDVRNILKKRRVRINDEIITRPHVHVDPNSQTVFVDNEEVFYREFIYLMLNKPQGYITATEDKRHQTVLDLVPEIYSHFDLFPVGRLDKDTEGLLLLTNDGIVNHQLTTPNNDIYKTYFVEIDGIVTDDDCEQFEKGIVLDDGYKTKRAYLNIIESNSCSKVELSISEGKFHQVKRMFRSLGKRVTFLKRIKMGDLNLDNHLPLGTVRELNKNELDYITKLKEGD